MLSIRFDDNTEWWVSGQCFQRLFQSALDLAVLPSDLAHLRDVAEANGGLEVSLLDVGERQALTQALWQAARFDLQRLRPVDLLSDDGSYQISLQKLLNLPGKLA